MLTFTPELFVLGGALLVFLGDVVGVKRIEAFGGIAVAAIVATLGLVLADLGFGPLAMFRTVSAASVDVPISAGALYSVTSLGLVFQGIFLLAALLVALASLSRPSREPGAAVFYGLLLLATLGMMLVAVATDLIFLLLALEVTAISSYLLVGYPRRDPRGLEAAMKFYIIGALSAAMAFFGASLLYGAYGTTSLAVLGHALPGNGNDGLAIAGYAFLLVGLGFEVTAVPFHMWAVDVYDGAPTDVSAFLAGGTKKVGLFAFFLVFLGPILLVSAPAATGARFHGSVQLTLALLAVATMTVGNVLALLQKEMKRLLAYSSISQAGYMLLGISIGTAPAIAGATFQIFAHVFLKAGAFLVVAAVAGLGVGPLVSDWKGLGVRRPGLGAAFALMLLGLAGIPLTVGFFSKFVLFSAAVEAQGLFVWLAVAGLFNSALSVFYYARVLRVMYMERAEDGEVPAVTESASLLAFDGLGWGRAAAIGLCVVAIVGFGLYPGPVLNGIQAAADHFVALGV
ncbi:MAG TPA: NADH-quinone oxidoreductase subunit N [Thermoplasmata archaeon]|nr:NADH-quinone oxidoreductase subunit N [Thermoplasmata archaeon]